MNVIRAQDGEIYFHIIYIESFIHVNCFQKTHSH
jgi:hypothetical protein